jgi:3-oxoacyl-[acyl-carrier protein] reductase
MSVHVANLNAVVTGGTKGIGLAISNLLRDNNWNVKSLSSGDFDLRNPKGFSEWVKESNPPTPYLIVCNAGMNNPKSIKEQSELEFQDINQTNFLSNIALIKYFLPGMIKNDFGGRVIFISSAFVSRSKFGRSAYSASKAAMESFIRSCAIEYANNRILFNSIAPGFIETKLTYKNNTDKEIEEITKRIPLQRLGIPEEIASLVMYLGSSQNSYITGQTINIDGGFSIT